MKTLSYPSWGLAFLIFLVLFGAVVNANFAAYEDCCPPPSLNPAAARFQKGAQVTVYLDTRTGFTGPELQAIEAGLEDWNDEPNNEFRYRAKIKDAKGAQVGRWMWDVFLSLN